MKTGICSPVLYSPPLLHHGFHHSDLFCCEISPQVCIWEKQANGCFSSLPLLDITQSSIISLMLLQLLQIHQAGWRCRCKMKGCPVKDKVREEGL